MEKINWKHLIEGKRGELETAIIKQWKLMLDEPETTSMRAVVLLWDDGDVTTGYRDQNSFSQGEHDGTAICIASFGSTKDECMDEFDSADEYRKFIEREYLVDVDDILDMAIADIG
ncbi:MAG: hypothetical protein VR68_11695 [Peptococcaceae bacterium BRH_c4a]|nr:MAG: hypothetical protein VR68_11695 [Peptococcaceae bacterium BRH_c4a]